MNRKNILLLTSDQQHWFTLGIDNPEIHTPNLDRLAARGTVYDRAYCVNPTCTPTRASIITGLYPSQHGAYSLGTKLPEDVHTVGEDFSDAGYRTALIGKAHFQQLKSTEEYPSLESYPIMQDLEFWRDFKGPFYGFEHVELARNHTDEAHVGQHYAIWMEEKGFTEWPGCFREPTGTKGPTRGHWNIPEEYHYDAWIAERTNALLEEYSRNGENFFLWASFFDPHPPYLVPEPWDKMYDPATLTVPQITPEEHDKNPPHFQMTQQEDADWSVYLEPDGSTAHGFWCHKQDRTITCENMATYYAMISLMDKYIGVILDKLDELGMTEDTVVVFTTDHGHFVGHHGLVGKGMFHYEDMLKVPYIVSCPGAYPEGARSDAMQSLVDMAPSIMGAAGLEVPRAMTGKDQSSVWEGNSDSVRDHVLVENHHQPTVLNCITYVEQQYKLTVYDNQTYGELFDLENDPGEIDNHWDDPAYAQIKAELMLKLIHAEMKKEPVWMPRVAGA